MALTSAYTSEPNLIPQVVAQLIQKGSGVEIDDLTAMIADATQETSITEANTVTVSLINPPLSLLYSGLFANDEKTQKMPVVDIEVDGVVYRLSDVAGTTDLTQANVTVEFKTRGAVLLDDFKAKKTIKATRSSKMTRAEFLNKRSKDVTEDGGIDFYAPQLDVVQPIGSGNEDYQDATVAKTHAKVLRDNKRVTAKNVKHSKRKKSDGSQSVGGGWTRVGATEDCWWTPYGYSESDFASHQACGSGYYNGGMSYAELLVAGANAGLSGQALGPTLNINTHSAHGGMADGTKLDIRLPGSNTFFTIQKSDVGSGQGGDPHYKIDLHPEIVWSLTGRARGDRTLFTGDVEVRPHDPSEQASSGSNSSTTTTTDKPYEFTIPKRQAYSIGFQNLAQEVNWPLYWDRDTLVFINSYDLISQRPIATIDVVTGEMTSAVILKHDGTREYSKHEHKLGRVVSSFSFDNDQRSITTECSLSVICRPAFFAAGDVIILTDPAGKGPWATGRFGGRWVITDCQRELINGQRSQLTLNIPGTDGLPAPKDEPKPETVSKTSSSGSGGPWKGDTNFKQYPTKTVARALAAAKYIDSLKLPYVWGGFRTIGQNPTGGMDCSGSSNWVLGAAGWDVGSSSPGSGSMMSWGEGGPGKELTIHASDGHEFLEFHVGNTHLQFNTVNPGDQGPRLYQWDAYSNSDAGQGVYSNSAFVSRHPFGA